MTNLTAIQSKALLNYPVEETVFILALEEAGLVAESQYVAETNQRALELCIADILLTLITSAKQISDDGFSVTMADVPELWRARNRWRAKWGLADDTPTTDQPIITDLSKFW